MGGVAHAQDSDAVSRCVNPAEVVISIVLSLVYALLFAVWIVVTLDKIRKGPEEDYAPARPGRKGAR